MVSAGDADINFKLRNFSANVLFFDKAWPERDIPLNWTYDVGENIYRSHNVNNIRVTAPLYFGYYLSDPGVDPLDDVPVNNGVYYYDTDLSNTLNPGDIRVFDLQNNYKAGSVVRWGDTDAIGTPRYFEDSPGPAISVPVLVLLSTGVPRPIAAYVDMDKDNTISAGDIRLNRIYGYNPYTYVYTGDNDVASMPVMPNVMVGLFDYNSRDQLAFDFNANNTIDLNDLRLTPYHITVGDRRLTDVTISDVTYVCGSDLTVGNFWVNENPVHGLSMGLNSDFRYIDWEVLPSSKIGLNVKIDRQFKVEQTSQIDVTVDPAPRPARWEDGIFYPAEKVYIIIKNVEGPEGSQLHEDYKQITAENPLATFQFTPYRGSCPTNGSSFGYRKVYKDMRKTAIETEASIHGYYDLEPYDLRVQIIAYKDDGGVDTPAPASDALVDPFWVVHVAGRTLNNSGSVNGDYAYTPPHYPIPPLPPEMLHTYDCYGVAKYEVAPEELTFVSSKKCVGVLDQRFPNLTIKLLDADNPLDVNV